MFTDHSSCGQFQFSIKNKKLFTRFLRHYVIYLYGFDF